MPVVMCSFCEYLGNGEEVFSKWRDVEEHEEKEHKKELAELRKGQ